MMRHRTLGPLSSLWGAALLVTLLSCPHARAADGPEVVVRRALLANPVTAPYNLLTSYSNGQVVLAGTVGSKQIHDIAIRLAINTGYPIRDDLVIDTAMAHRVAAAQAQWQAQAAAAGRPPGSMGSAGLVPSLGMTPGGLPYVYPPPLFGRIDDPFFGFEPPLLSYPPWWGAVVARAQAGASPMASVNPSPAIGAGSGMPNAGSVAYPSGPVSLPLGSSPQDGTIEMTIDPRGRAVLRGTVPTLADRIAIGQKIAQTPGVSEVINLLQLGATTLPTLTPTPSPSPSPETTPPPPQPGLSPALQPPAGAAPPPDANGAAQEQAIVVDGGALNERLTQAFARRPALAGLPMKVTVRDGIASLSGKVPTVYEAMLAFRVVEQTPGIREVNDRLEFTVPDGERQNPLIKQGRPEDVEPYLAAQIRRNLGDLAHLDRIKLLGDNLELWGTIAHPEDRPRVDAILRSIAVLRGFHLVPHFDAE